MIVIQDVNKKVFRKEILKNISLTIPKGILGVLGPNGAGKTTLLKILAKVVQPTSGKVLHYSNSNKKIVGNELYSIGYLPQSFSSFEQLTCKDSISLYAALKKSNTSNKAVEDVLSKVNLLKVKDEKVKNLSGGMIRRIGIAQTLIGNPEILIIDEPTTGLDIAERIRFRKILKDLAKERTIILSSHIVEDLEAICDRFVIMDQGSIIAHGTKEEILENTKTKVQKLVIPYNKFQDFDSEYNISSFIHISKEEEEEYELRIISDRQINNSSIETTPNLEECYIKILNEV